MKKVLLITLTALFFVLSMSACGSKSDDTNSNANVSHVLYSDDDSSAAETKQVTTTSSSESEKDTETESKTDSETTDKDTASEKDSESKKSSSSSKSETSSASSSSKSAASSQSSSSAASSVTTDAQSTAVVSNAPIDNQSSENSSANNTESTSVNNETDKDNSDAESDNSSEETSDNDTQSSGEFDESDLVISISGAEIQLEDNINDVVAAFGQPIDIISAPSCKYSGFEDKTYIYDGFTVNTYPNADGSIDYVVGVEVTSDTYETAKGISIGSELDAVFKAYGEEYVTLGSTYRYIIDSKILSFYIEDDKVNSISYIFDN